jgi:hypothetical protein
MSTRKTATKPRKPAAPTAPKSLKVAANLKAGLLPGELAKHQ